MKIELEICPVCETKNYKDYALGGECLSCGWYPICIPYDDEDIVEAKNKLKQNERKSKTKQPNRAS